MYDLEITNYQIIKHGNIQFKPGLTLITGHSNNGKSSIFKAFRQLVYNNPGSDYISHNQSKTTLKLITPNQDQIVYSKSHSGASYQINSEAPLTKIGSSQVPQIKDLLHINKDLNYNFWNQLEKPFLISLSSKEQFDLLQQSPHTQTLQNCLQSITQDRKDIQNQLLQNQSQLQLIQEQNQQFQNQLTSLPTLTNLYNQINVLKDKQSQIQNLLSTFQLYSNIDLNSLQSQLSKLQNIPNLNHLNSQFNLLNDLKSLFQQLLQTQSPIQEYKNQIQNLQTKIDQIKLFTQTQFTICPLCNQPFHNHN